MRDAKLDPKEREIASIRRQHRYRYVILSKEIVPNDPAVAC